MEIKCVAIDDEPLALELIKQYIEKFPTLKLMRSFTDAVSGAEYLRNNTIDLLFIDINMPDITGIDLVRSLQVKPLTIFTTAYKKFAFEGFELEAIDYLLKPIDFERFKKAVNRAVEFQQYKQNAPKEKDDSLFVRSEYRMVKIPLHDIEYIESLEDYIKIHIAGQRPVMSLMTLKTVLEKLPAGQFRRIHRSYIVPVNKVKSILNRKVQLSNNVELPVSNNYSDFIDEWKKG